MRLFEHPDFDQAILRAEEHFRDRGLRPSIIEKDYYVTEALRIIAETTGDRVIFKGGTSLSKGWNLIERFSEDIDLFLDPLTFVREESAASGAATASPAGGRRRGGWKQPSHARWATVDAASAIIRPNAVPVSCRRQEA